MPKEAKDGRRNDVLGDLQVKQKNPHVAQRIAKCGKY
jgi:hypothetical protein